MSTPRDPDVVLAAWLDDGPADLPSSTRRAISTAVRTTPQARAGLGLPAWRPSMSDFMLRRGCRGRRGRPSACSRSPPPETPAGSAGSRPAPSPVHQPSSPTPSAPIAVACDAVAEPMTRRSTRADGSPSPRCPIRLHGRASSGMDRRLVLVTGLRSRDADRLRQPRPPSDLVHRPAARSQRADKSLVPPSPSTLQRARRWPTGPASTCRPMDMVSVNWHLNAVPDP